MMQAGILRRSVERLVQNVFRLGIASELAIEIGKVSSCWCKRGTEAKRRLKLRFGLARQSALCIEAAKRRMCLRPVGVQRLRGDELLHRAVEEFAVGSLQLIGSQRREQRRRL